MCSVKQALVQPCRIAGHYTVTAVVFRIYLSYYNLLYFTLILGITIWFEVPLKSVPHQLDQCLTKQCDILILIIYSCSYCDCVLRLE